MEPPPPTSPSENPTSAPEASAARIVAIIVALLSWARRGETRNAAIVSDHPVKQRPWQQLRQPVADRGNDQAAGRRGKGRQTSTLPQAGSTRANMAASVNFLPTGAARGAGTADARSGICPQKMGC